MKRAELEAKLNVVLQQMISRCADPKDQAALKSADLFHNLQGLPMDIVGFSVSNTSGTNRLHISFTLGHFEKTPPEILASEGLESLQTAKTADQAGTTAVQMAVLRSNQEAMRLYHIEPFKEAHGQWRDAGKQRVWEALTSSGGRDLVAKVTFDEEGQVLNVNVQMLAPDGSTPPANFQLPGQDMQLKPVSGIPEVMPKQNSTN